ncbi:MAG: hypothetical protein KatS3mg008_1249 [Acidimicrobiales bacterium]|nr:MAG: hypothetical protein KatS3mg008_1249 [Acidimicrobiales bacterium]
MTGWLALVGGEEWTDGCSFDRDLLEAAEVRRVLVVPAAAAFENFRRLLERAERWFEALGAEMDVLEVFRREDAMDEKNAGKVSGAGLIYLCDGGSMHLRSVLKDSLVWKACLEAWRSGAVLAGSGAGADVLCDPMVDPRGGAFTVGLGLLHRLSVIPRFDSWSHEKIHRTVTLAPPDVVLAGIPNGTALIRRADGSWYASGVGEVELFRAGQPVGLEVLEGVRVDGSS